MLHSTYKEYHIKQTFSLSVCMCVCVRPLLHSGMLFQI